MRKLIRRCFSLSEDVFEKNGREMLSELVKGVTESLGTTVKYIIFTKTNLKPLGDHYPELQNNLNRSLNILEREHDSYLQARSKIHTEWKRHLQNHPALHIISDPENYRGLAEAVNLVKVGHIHSYLKILFPKN
jgi:hypothetical protein